MDLNGQIKTKQKSRKNRPHHIDTDPLTDQTGFSLIFLLNYFLSCPLCRSHFTSPFPPKLNNKDKNRTKLHYQKTNEFFFSVLKSRKLCVLTLENKQENFETKFEKEKKRKKKERGNNGGASSNGGVKRASGVRT